MCPCVIPTSYSQAYHVCKGSPDARACLLCSNDDYVLALTDGAFNKLLQIQLVRKVEGEQFFGVSLCVPAFDCSCTCLYFDSTEPYSHSRYSLNMLH